MGNVETLTHHHVHTPVSVAELVGYRPQGTELIDPRNPGWLETGDLIFFHGTGLRAWLLATFVTRCGFTHVGMVVRIPVGDTTELALIECVHNVDDVPFLTQCRASRERSPQAPVTTSLLEEGPAPTTTRPQRRWPITTAGNPGVRVVRLADRLAAYVRDAPAATPYVRIGIVQVAQNAGDVGLRARWNEMLCREIIPQIEGREWSAQAVVSSTFRLGSTSAAAEAPIPPSFTCVSLVAYLIQRLGIMQWPRWETYRNVCDFVTGNALSAQYANRTQFTSYKRVMTHYQVISPQLE